MTALRRIVFPGRRCRRQQHSRRQQHHGANPRTLMLCAPVLRAGQVPAGVANFGFGPSLLVRRVSLAASFGKCCEKVMHGALARRYADRPEHILLAQDTGDRCFRNGGIIVWKFLRCGSRREQPRSRPRWRGEVEELDSRSVPAACSCRTSMSRHAAAPCRRILNGEGVSTAVPRIINGQPTARLLRRGPGRQPL